MHIVVEQNDDDRGAATGVHTRGDSEGWAGARPLPWRRLAAADLVALLGAWMLTGLMLPLSAASVVVIATAGVCLLAGQHLYAEDLVEMRTLELRGVLLACVYLTAAAAIVASLGQASPAAVAVGGAASLVALVVTRVVYRAWLRNARAAGRFVRHVVLVGADEQAGATRQRWEERPELGVEVVAAFGSRHQADRHGLDDIWAGEVGDAAASPTVRRADATFVSLATLDRDDVDTIVGRLRRAAPGPLHVSSGIALADHARLRPVNLDYELFVRVDAPGRLRAKQWAKRVLDVAVGSLVLVLALPVLVVAAAAVKLDDRGPVLFRQPRVGRDGRLFTILKLRTMSVDAEARRAGLGGHNERAGPLFKIERDPRLTRVGSVIRQLSVDELPQLWNVLRGDMSLVGPRPALPGEVERFDDRLRERSQVRPGITGLWQVEARDVASFEAYRRLDLFYVDHWSMALDLAILIGTVESELARVARLVRHRLRRRGDRPRPTAARLPPRAVEPVAATEQVQDLARAAEPAGRALVPVSEPADASVAAPGALAPPGQPKLATVAGERPSGSDAGSRSPAAVIGRAARAHLRIAMVGTRGVPARYGGFETAVEEIGRRLVERGHDVTVYCRSGSADASRSKRHLGMRLVTLPALHLRSAETLSHSALSSVHAVLSRRPDAVFVFNSANAVLLPLLHAGGLPVAVHVDGLEWRRGKWAGTGARYYRRAEALAVRWADALIADAPGIREYYEQEFGADTELLGYGAPVLDDLPDDRLAELHVTRQKFHLVVARFEPENNVELVVRGYHESAATCPLVVVGSAPYSKGYRAVIGTIAASDDRVKLVGSLWDQDQLNQLYRHGLLYLHGHSVGGTNPSLLRAMGAGAAVAAYDVRFNRDVLGDDGWFFTEDRDVARVVEAAERDPACCEACGAKLRARVAQHHRWDAVADGYEDLARRLAAGASRAGEATGRRAGEDRRVGVPGPGALRPAPARRDGSRIQGGRLARSFLRQLPRSSTRRSPC